MAKYLLTYHGGSEPATEEEGQAVMAAWYGWFGQLGAAVVDGGNPTMGWRTISGDGSVAASGSVTGYSILSADSFDDAVEMAKGCPHLQAMGTRVEVGEIHEIPM